MAKKLTEDQINWILSVDASEAQQEIRKLVKTNRELVNVNKERRQELIKLEAQGKKETEKETEPERRPSRPSSGGGSGSSGPNFSNTSYVPEGPGVVLETVEVPVVMTVEEPAAIPETEAVVTTAAPQPQPVKVAPKKAAAEPVIVERTEIPKTGDKFMVMVKTLSILGVVMGVGFVVYANRSRKEN